ncbi:MAG: hypothetical protein K2Y20_12550 [Sphingomonas sp.]|nr:hypothetical protein [Sphingomonas sp.]
MPRARDAAVETAAEAIERAVPDARVSTEPGRVVVEGKGLAKRWAMSAALRWIKGLLR